MAYPQSNPLKRLDDVPPFLAHALARESNGKKRLPLDVIVQRSGLSERTYLRTASKNSWDSVKFGVMKAFLRGCGISPWLMRNHWRYLREHNYRPEYLTKKQWDLLNRRCQVKPSTEKK